MKRRFPLLVLTLLASCAAQPGAGPATTATAKRIEAAICRVGADGAPLVADRGIGGTGGPALADRGIGGTGVVGVITGFASICINGLEVRYDSTAAVDIEGKRAATTDLRAGQVVAIETEGGDQSARTISVRREVIGPVEKIERGRATVAGQAVVVASATWGARRLHIGDSVAVSGLRRPDGVILASRIDPAPSGAFVVRGQVARTAGTAHVGRLRLDEIASAGLDNGQFVELSGRYISGRAVVSEVVQDGLASEPASFFPASVSHLVIQGTVRLAQDAVWLNGAKISAGPNLHGLARPEGIAIVSLNRQPDGGFIADDIRDAAFPSYPVAEQPRSGAPLRRGVHAPARIVVPTAKPEAMRSPIAPVEPPVATSVAAIPLAEPRATAAEMLPAVLPVPSSRKQPPKLPKSVLNPGGAADDSASPSATSDKISGIAASPTGVVTGAVTSAPTTDGDSGAPSGLAPSTVASKAKRSTAAASSVHRSSDLRDGGPNGH